jgi:hypothetical protein
MFRYENSRQIYFSRASSSAFDKSESQGKYTDLIIPFNVNCRFTKRCLFFMIIVISKGNSVLM